MIVGLDKSDMVNQHLLESLQRIKKLVNKKNATFQINICSTANLHSFTEEQKVEIIKPLYELNDKQPILQSIKSCRDNDYTNMQLWNLDESGTKSYSEELKFPDFLRTYLPDEERHEGLNKQYAMDCNIVTRLLAEYLKANNPDCKDREIKDLQLALIKDIEGNYKDFFLATQRILKDI